MTRVLTLAMAIWLACAAAHAQSGRVEAWTADINYLATEIPRRHPNAFSVTPRATFENMLEAVRRDIASLTDYGIALRLQQAVAALADAHTEVDVRLPPITVYPLRLFLFDDGIFVTKTNAASADACGARLVAIDGTPAAEVYARVATTISRENESWAMHRAMALAMRAELLQQLGVTASAQEARFTFERDGVVFDVQLRPIPAAEALATINAPDAASAQTPLHRRQSASRYWFTRDDERGLLYIKYNLCAEDPAISFARFMQQITPSLDDRAIRTVVIDLRDNPGGNSAVAQPLITALKQRPSLRGRVFAIIGRATISSAVINAIQLRDEAGAILVGEPTGGKPWSYGEQRSFALPRSGVTVFHSTRFFRLGAVDTPSLEPEIVASVTSADFFRNRDPFLEALLPRQVSMAAGDTALRRRAAFPLQRVCP